MIIPVRCFTCGSVVSAKWEPYAERVRAGEEPKAVMDDLGVERYCCRRMILAHSDTIEEISQYVI